MSSLVYTEFNTTNIYLMLIFSCRNCFAYNLADLDIGMTSVTGAKLSTAPLLLVVRIELRIP